MSAHLSTDPGCVHHAEPVTFLERYRFEKNRGIPCPSCFGGRSRPERLMPWRTPRLSQGAHVTLVVAVTAVLLVAGVVVCWAIPSTALGIFASGAWGFTLGCAAIAYAQERIR